MGRCYEKKRILKIENYVNVWYNIFIKNPKGGYPMLLVLIIIGMFIRSCYPTLFACLAIGFLAFLVITAFAGIKEGKFGWKEAIVTVFYIVVILWLM